MKIYAKSLMNSTKERIKYVKQLTDPAELATYVNDTSGMVLLELIKNPNTSLDTLWELADSDNVTARENLAAWKGTPEEILRYLSDDPSDIVRFDLAAHPKLPKDILEKLAYDEDYTVRSMAVKYGDLPLDILLDLADDESDAVREAVVRKLPKEYVESFLDDEDSDVRKAAEMKLGLRSPWAAYEKYQ